MIVLQAAMGAGMILIGLFVVMFLFGVPLIMNFLKRNEKDEEMGFLSRFAVSLALIIFIFFIFILILDKLIPSFD